MTIRKIGKTKRRTRPRTSVEETPRSARSSEERLPGRSVSPAERTEVVDTGARASDEPGPPPARSSEDSPASGSVRPTKRTGAVDTGVPARFGRTPPPSRSSEDAPPSSNGPRPGRSPVLEDWVATSTVRVLGLVARQRSPELQLLDGAVAGLAQARQIGSREALSAARGVVQQLRAWRKAQGADRGQQSIRAEAIGQLETAVDGVFASYYVPRAAAMRRVPSEDHLPPERVWVHGTDAIGEILASGEVWGGTAAAKGGDDSARVVAARGQEEQAKVQPLHFFMARTEPDGVARTPGSAYIKGRQAGADKIAKETPLASWESAGRPLLGVIEFEYDVKDDVDHMGNSPSLGGVRIVSTPEPDAKGISALPLAELRPLAIRVASEEDAVRLIEFVRVNGRIQQFPAEIHVLAKPTPLPDNDLLTGNPSRTAAARTLCTDSGDFHRLMTEEPAAWKIYRTAAVLAALPG
jgi:hypothetical protein